MSEPMNAVEIEDVLSSIRRLVSEDLRPTHKLVSAALNKAGQKLILTPALRIVPAARVTAGQGIVGQSNPSLRQENAAEAGSTGAAVFGSVRAQDSRPAVDTIDTTDTATLDANFLATAMSRINGLSVTKDIAVRPGPSETIEAVVAVVGAAVGPEEWELDGGEPAPQAKAWRDAVWSADLSTDDAPADASPEPAAEQEFACQEDGNIHVQLDQLVDSLLILTQSETADDLSDPLVEQTAGSGIGGFVTVEPVGSPIAAGATPISADLDMLDRGGAATPDDADDPDDTGGFLSEDLLRVIVSDMIREELQGSLGERITRNVRKLVRSEISRALASRDFEDIASG